MKRNKEWIEGLRVFLKKSVFGQDEAIDVLCSAMAIGEPGVILAGEPGMGKTLILQRVLQFVHEKGGVGDSVPMITCVVPAGIERQLSDRGKVAKALEKSPEAVIGFDGMGLVKEPVREGLLKLLAEPNYRTGNGVVLPTEDAFLIFTTALTLGDVIKDLDRQVTEAVVDAWIDLEPMTEDKGTRFVGALMTEMARTIRSFVGARISWDENAVLSVYRKTGDNPNYQRLKMQVTKMMEQITTTALDCDYEQYDLEICCHGYVGEKNQLEAIIKATKKEEK
ncbi:MAG: hypothetical protein IKU83_04200 [Lachnospiraceae bacterium]|nr:hypothetical protein [Lachnospiraceae bacterium]